ncbi:unnamed protein product [Pleuronectes platessa]|uniref:Uncharacterized protein n=1 Tax=Pleuronectes platessa TaxID=8262 RepID=A0A9N7Y9A6_PLEPL|nr:unnamed protein product [Pleuronectes platessa]
MELMFSSHWRSWEMMVPRKRKDSAVTRGWVPSEVHNHLHCFQSIELQVVQITPGHQMVNLPPVGGLIPTREEPNEGGVISELKEFDGQVPGGAAVGIQGEEKRGKNTALRGTGQKLTGVEPSTSWSTPRSGSTIIIQDVDLWTMRQRDSGEEVQEELDAEALAPPPPLETLGTTAWILGAQGSSGDKDTSCSIQDKLQRVTDQESLSRSHRPGVTVQESPTRSHRPGVTDQESLTRSHCPGVTDQESLSRSHRPGVTDQESPTRSH